MSFKPVIEEAKGESKRTKPKFAMVTPADEGEEWVFYEFPGQLHESMFHGGAKKQASKKAIRRLAKAKYGAGEDSWNRPVCVHLMTMTGKNKGRVDTYCGLVRAAEQNELTDYARSRGFKTVVEFTDQGEE